MKKNWGKYVIGIDEVGRGALAGPVTVAAVILPRELSVGSHELGKLRDSKQLTPRQREAWCAHFENHPRIEYAVARVYPRAIERLNISGAANLAALRAFKKITTHSSPFVVRPRVFLDGGLFLGSRKAQSGKAKTVVKGDEKIPVVAIASIIAKVYRDHAMVRLAKQYPQYGFEIHKGYGTKAHMRAIKKLGSCKAHRLTFLS